MATEATKDGITSLKQLVLGRKDVQDLSDTEQELPSELMTVEAWELVR